MRVPPLATGAAALVAADGRGHDPAEVRLIELSEGVYKHRQQHRAYSPDLTHSQWPARIAQCTLAQHSG
jgi:hypothetical protein